MNKRMWSVGLLAASLLPAVAPAPASACGGFFCSTSPVDQFAERIVFAVDEQRDTTDMIVQIAYQGEDEAFAWLLPVGAVPQNRMVFPNGALAPLDAQTGPQFTLPPNCFGGVRAAGGANSADDSSAPPSTATPPSVMVHVQETVGPFEVAVIESESSEATFAWLLEHKYRLSSVMKPYIELYTKEKMKFLALRLSADASVKDIQPFKMTLPGSTPSVPLRLTAIAAEPEMGVLVWILGQRRYEPANAEELTIPKEELRYRFGSFSLETNWTQLVARHVDEAGGRGWVVEQAGASEQVVRFLQTSLSGAAQDEARAALLGLFEGKPYFTRLYTRLSPEEMSYDPSFRRSDKGDVSRQVELPYLRDVCASLTRLPSAGPCDFAACGQLGVCREVMDPTTKSKIAGCGCAPGMTARTTFAPDGQVTVTCQDQRMSFMNPGESDEAGAKFADPCVGYSCGEFGHCVAMNLTPTCACDQGYVALGSLGADGARQTRCVAPIVAVPKAFYSRRPPQLGEGMVSGREVVAPTPELSDPPGAERASADGCSVGSPTSSKGAQAWLAGAVLAWVLRRRRRAR